MKIDWPQFYGTEDLCNSALAPDPSLACLPTASKAVNIAGSTSYNIFAVYFLLFTGVEAAAVAFSESAVPDCQLAEGTCVSKVQPCTVLAHIAPYLKLSRTFGELQPY